MLTQEEIKAKLDNLLWLEGDAAKALPADDVRRGILPSVFQKIERLDNEGLQASELRNELQKIVEETAADWWLKQKGKEGQAVIDEVNQRIETEKSS